MAEKSIDRFQRNYENLAGVVHQAKNPAEAARIVGSILRRAKPQRVALGELPEQLRQMITEQCTRAGVQVITPPFHHTTLPEAIDTAQIGISMADFAIAETGTIVEFSTDDAYRLVSTLPRVHVGIVKVQDMLERLQDAAPRVRDFFLRHPRNGTVTFISGPSRSGDIEMRLTLGVHGPEKTHAIVLQED